MENYDKELLAKTLDQMTLQQRREWIVKIKMAQLGRTFQAMAKKHRLSTVYLAGSVSGVYPWGPKVLHALEVELEADLGCLLSEAEAVKCGFDVV